MYVGLKNIQSLFKEYPSMMPYSDGMHCLTGWVFLKDAPCPYASYLLYVCTSHDLENVGQLTDQHVLCITAPGEDQKEIADKFQDDFSLLLIECEDQHEIYISLQQYFNQQCGVGMFGQTLLEFLSFDDGLQSAVEYSYNVFRNPIFVFDTNYNLVAATWKAVEELDIQDQVVVTKRFSPEDFKMANRLHNIHSKVLKSEIPICAYNDELGYEQMYCSINTTRNLGHIVVSAINKPFEPIDTEFLLMLKKFVDQQMKKDSFIRNAKGFNYEYFLRDLLDEKIGAGTNGTEHMKYTGSTFSGNMYCMVVETARSAATVNTTHIRNVIESRFPYSRTLIYNGQIITILSFQDKQLLSPEYIEAGRKICIDNGLYAGISNCFQNIMDIRAFYSQALRAIEYGTEDHGEPELYRYADYYLKHVTGMFLQKESARIFCHPKMMFLLEYDKKHNSELAYTLYMYLVHERNLAAASEAMDMHRTSLVYRFKKINTLIGDDFDDYKERLYMILSYEMNQKD